jgi:hypothetical protein
MIRQLLINLAIGACVGAQALAMIHYYNGPHGLTIEVLPFTFLLALTYLIFMLPSALIIGVPVFLLLRRNGWLNGWTVIGIGTVVGAGWALPFSGYYPPPYDLALFFGLGGLISSAIFWLLERRSNPPLNTDAGVKAARAG